MSYGRILAICFLCFSNANVQADDVVLRWNSVLTEVLRADTEIQNPGMASRSMAMMNIAMYDAINSIQPTHREFYAHDDAPAGAIPEVAALQAGYRVLSSVYPNQHSLLDQQRELILTDLGYTDVDSTSVGFGNAIGEAVVDFRLDDGFMNMVSYTPSSGPGHWRPDPLNPSQTAWGTEWGQIRTFAIPGSDLYLPSEMPALSSQAYTDAFNEVKALGAKDSTVRTDEQTEIGLFWAYDREGMGTPMRMYNRILQTIANNEGNDLSENARLFAMASTSVADAGIVAWDTKFTYDFWRPVTGIREADSDGNSATHADPDWTPLGAPGGMLDDGTIVPDFTPPFPTYVSGHATFGGALFGAIHDFYGTDALEFEVTSDEMPGTVRSFDSLSSAMEENGRSRVYLGIHWDFDDFVARDLGGEVAGYVSSQHFQSVPEPRFTSLTFAMLALASFLVRTSRKVARH